MSGKTCLCARFGFCPERAAYRLRGGPLCEGTVLRCTVSRGHHFARMPQRNCCLQGDRFRGRPKLNKTAHFPKVKKEFLRLGLAAYLKDMLHEIKSLQIGYKLAKRHAT